MPTTKAKRMPRPRTTTQDSLDLIMRLRDVSDMELSRRLEGFSHQRIQQRRRGETGIKADELRKFAPALGVPVELFSEKRRGVLAWFAEHPSYAAGDSNPEPADQGFWQLSLTEREPGEVVDLTAAEMAERQHTARVLVDSRSA